jgi:hypothetical protein
MTPDEARDLLWTAPKEQRLDAAVYDAMLHLHDRGELQELLGPVPVRVNELGEFVMGGGIADGDTAPTLRFSRSEDAA